MPHSVSAPRLQVLTLGGSSGGFPGDLTLLNGFSIFRPVPEFEMRDFLSPLLKSGTTSISGEREGGVLEVLLHFRTCSLPA